MPFDLKQPDAVFWVFTAMVAGLLFVAAVILAVLTWLHRDVSAVWRTYRSWLVLAPLAYAAVYFGRVPTIALFTLFAVLGFKEFARATGLDDDWWMSGAGYAVVLAAGIIALLRNPYTGMPGWYNLYMALPVYAITLVVLIPILRNRVEGQVRMMSLTIMGSIFIGWMFLHLALLADRPQAVGSLLFLLLAVELNDVAAFTFGKALGGSGRHLLRWRISPRKTWEGAISAVAVSMILPWLLRFALPPYFGAAQLLLTGLIVGVGGQLGDLSISLIKRDVGIKDMGRLIPGHGGMLDRTDSLIYTAPLFLHLVRFCSPVG